MEKLNESFVYNYNNFIRDVKTLQNELDTYIDNACVYYDEILIEQEKVEDYYQLLDESQEVKYFYEFFCRPYETFMIPKIKELKDKMAELLFAENRPVNYDLICDFECSRLDNLLNTWEEFLNESLNQPLLNLAEYDYKPICGVQVYITKECSEKRTKQIESLVYNIANKFPNLILKLDGVIVVSKEYIELAGGEGTMAYFVEDALFISAEEPQDFTDKVCAYHEFGHFIYQNLSLTSHIYWDKMIRDCIKNDIKMTRDNERNSQLDEENDYDIWSEECFADVTGLYFCHNDVTDDDYIHLPSKKILKEWCFVMNQEFQRNDFELDI